MIECHDVTKRVGRQVVLSGVDLVIERGERVALLGLNGAGKTTLLRCMLGLARFSGDIRIDGRPPENVIARDRMVYVPQRPPRFHATLTGFLRWFADLRAIDVTRVEQEVEGFGLDLRRHGGKRLTELSGGMLQKAVLGLALASDADVLLLDEPTANLDAESRLLLLKRLSELGPERTIVICSHRLDDLVEIVDRAVVLERGTVIHDGPIRGLRSGAEDGVLPLYSGALDSGFDESAMDLAVLGLGGGRSLS